MDFNNINEGFDNSSEELHFYYNREERLKNAPQIVQDYYSGKSGRPVKGLFKVLFSTKGNRVLFISMVLFIAFIWGFNFLSSNKSSTINDVNCELKAFLYSEEIFVSLELKESKNNSEHIEKKVSVIFESIDNANSVNSKQEAIYEVYNGKQLFLRTKFIDYDIIKVKAYVTVGDKQKELSASVMR